MTTTPTATHPNSPPPSERGCVSPERAEIDRVAHILIAEWERVERAPVNVSYLATFADMARVVIADRAERVRVVVRDAVDEEFTYKHSDASIVNADWPEIRDAIAERVAEKLAGKVRP